MSLPASYYRHVCTVIRQGAPDAWGAQAEGARTVVPCRYTTACREVTAPDGQRVMSRAQVRLATAVAPGDTIELGAPARAARVVRVETMHDLGGTVIGYLVDLG